MRTQSSEELSTLNQALEEMFSRARFARRNELQKGDLVAVGKGTRILAKTSKAFESASHRSSKVLGPFCVVGVYEHRVVEFQSFSRKETWLASEECLLKLGTEVKVFVENRTFLWKRHRGLKPQKGIRNAD